MALSLSSRFCPMPWRGKEKGNQIAENDEASVFVSLLLDIEYNIWPSSIIRASCICTMNTTEIGCIIGRH